MRVRARKIERHAAPANVQLYFGQYFLTVGAEYEVEAISVFTGIVFFQVIDDVNLPMFLPAVLFEVTATDIPADWICSAFDGEPTLVVGPPEVAKTQDAYGAMAELEPKQVASFWERVRRRRSAADPDDDE